MRLRPGLLVALVVAAACVDPAGPAERFGQVSLRATFATGEAPGDFGVAVDSVHVLIERSGGAAALVDTVIAYADGEVSSWVLDLLADEELLSVEMELRGGASKLYLGSGEVTARAGEIGETDIQGVPVVYRGPPPTDSVVVAPDRVTMAAVGDQVRLLASALGRDGSVLAGKSFAWSSSATSIATVDDQGLVRALEDGLTTITAIVDGVTGRASVTVAVVAAVVTSTIEAAPEVLPADGVSQAGVRVRLLDANRNPLGRSGGDVTLATTLGSLSAVRDHDDGTYSAVLTSPVVGQATITGELGGDPFADTAVVAFHAGPPSPATSTISAQPNSAPADGASPVTITVRLFDANGNPLTASGGAVILRTTQGSLSPVTDHDDGSYTATLTSRQVGTALLSGLLDGVAIADTATAAFLAGPASPTTTTLRADPRRVAVDPVLGTVIWVRLFDAQGNRLTTSGGTLTLSTTLGSLGPVVDRGDGTYTATLQSSVPGRAVVTGTLNGLPMTASDDVQFVRVTGTP